MNEEVKEQIGRTFLKSVNHIRILDKRGNRVRSIAVGLQFGIIHYPGEVLSVVIWPLITNLIGSLYAAISNLIFITVAAGQAILAGFAGHVDAVDEIEEYEDDE